MYRLKSKTIFVMAMVLIIAMSVSGCTGKDEKGLVAKVNGEGITQEEYDVNFQVNKNLYERKFGEGALSEVGSDGKMLETLFKEDTLNVLIVERLIMQDAAKKGIEVSKEEVQERLDNISDSLDGKDKLDESLKSNDIPMDYFEDYTEKEILMEKYKKDFMDNINISMEDAEKYFNENKDELVVLRARYILVNNEEDGKEILRRLDAGEDFAELATKKSLHSSSAIKGGDLGYFAKGTFASIPDFEDAVFSLKVGETSDLIKTETGYHIVRIEDRKDTFEELKDEIMILLKEEEYTKHVQKLKDNAKIKIITKFKDEK
ncbi:MAG: SurA N-terminal domain-containing protein [Tissierellaceae bacterium]